MKTKKEIREYIKNLFSTGDTGNMILKNQSITHKVISCILDRKFKHVCIYESLSDEVNTSEIISALEKKGVNIYTPQVISETEMIIIDSDYEVYEKEIDAFIIPGRAFTKEGKRLGRGKGYYDRFFAHGKYKKSLKIGLSYDFQLLESIISEPHDIDLNKIISN